MLLNAFNFFGGSPKELVVDNMLTAVIERQGPLVRFNDHFLDFLRPLKIVPRACNVRAPHEKGKIESGIKYLKKNFWPLRKFNNLDDVQQQVIEWLDKFANVRNHQTTGERPVERFVKNALRRLPEGLPDTRETVTLKVYSDFTVRFETNAYMVPPWAIGKRVVLKAGPQTVKIYYRDKKIAAHSRCWGKKKRIETRYHREQAKKLKKKLWQDKDISVFSSLGPDAVAYLHSISDANLPIKKNILRLLELKDEYGAGSLLFAIRKAASYKAFGADYIENILYQEMTPETNHPPVKLKDKNLNRIRLEKPSLEDYDAHALKMRKK